jgi:hypothetical protein
MLHSAALERGEAQMLGYLKGECHLSCGLSNWRAFFVYRSLSSVIASKTVKRGFNHSSGFARLHQNATQWQINLATYVLC